MKEVSIAWKQYFQNKHFVSILESHGFDISKLSDEDKELICKVIVKLATGNLNDIRNTKYYKTYSERYEILVGKKLKDQNRNKMGLLYFDLASSIGVGFHDDSYKNIYKTKAGCS